MQAYSEKGGTVRHSDAGQAHGELFSEDDQIVQELYPRIRELFIPQASTGGFLRRDTRLSSSRHGAGTAGHSSLRTTEIYMHVRHRAISNVRRPIEQIVQKKEKHTYV